MKCTKCGTELPENETRCPNCGAETEIKSDAISGVAIKPRGFSSTRNIIIIFIAALVVLGGIGAAVAFGVSHSASHGSGSFQLAEKYLSDQNYEQAIIAFEQILEIEPMNVDAYLGLAEAYIGMSDKDKALEVLRKGLEMTGDARLQAKIDELDKPAFGSMGSVTILGQEIDIATTTSLLVYNKNLYENGEWVYGEDFESDFDSVIRIDEDLSAEDLDKITKLSWLKELDLSYVNIKDLSPLLNLKRLETLALRSNNINDITPLKYMVWLTRLNLIYNQVGDITPLAELTNLKELYLGSNQISDLTPLARLTNLVSLGLGNNPISDITPIVGLTDLTELDLDRCQISDITPLAGLTNLTNLDLWDNQISDADIERLRTQLPNCDISG